MIKFEDLKLSYVAFILAFLGSDLGYNDMKMANAGIHYVCANWINQCQYLYSYGKTLLINDFDNDFDNAKDYLDFVINLYYDRVY